MCGRKQADRTVYLKNMVCLFYNGVDLNGDSY